MDADGLPIVGPGIDYTKVEPIHPKTTLSFLNNFLIRTTTFLNNFSTVCDEKLEDLLTRIQRLESSMSILEAKLASIPGLEGAAAVASPPAQEQPKEVPLPALQQSDTSTPAAPPAPLPPPVEEAQPPPPKPTNTIAQDARFAKYFKMVTLGVPALAVKQKMQTEGYDPNLLDNPDQEAPPGSADPTSDYDEDSD